MKHKVRNRGFTLIELMTVMVIISLLASIAVPNFLNATLRARTARAICDQELVMWALETYRLDAEAYPVNRVAGRFSPPDLTPLTIPIPYMMALPPDAYIAPYKLTEKKIKEERSGYIGYTYVNFLQQYNGERLPLSRFGGNGTANYAVISVGPLVVEDVSFDEASGFTSYNPSNGVVSYGNIVTFGP